MQPSTTLEMIQSCCGQGRGTTVRDSALRRYIDNYDIDDDEHCDDDRTRALRQEARARHERKLLLSAQMARGNKQTNRNSVNFAHECESRVRVPSRSGWPHFHPSVSQIVCECLSVCSDPACWSALQTADDCTGNASQRQSTSHPIHRSINRATCRV